MFIRHRHDFRFRYSGRVTQGLHRTYSGRDLHFLTFSCYRRRPYLGDATRRDLFLQSLERVRRRCRSVVVGYVVMPEHVHLLVTEPQRETLSTVVQALKLSFVRSLELSGSKTCGGVPRSRKNGETWGTPDLDRSASGNKNNSGVPHFSPMLREVGIRNGEIPNPFWQARFYDFNVWTEKKRIEKLRYIHRNPVKRGLVESPEQWKWSSFRWYLRREPGPVRINDTDILVMKIHPTSR
jgi:REP-associated tyrosine transposase